MDLGKYKPFITFPSDNENVFIYMNKGAELLKYCEYSAEEVAQFLNEMTSGDYEQAKEVMKKWFHVNYLKEEKK